MNTKFDEMMLDPEFRKHYAVEGLIADTAEMIWQLLVQRNMKQADLARLLNKTPAFVSQLLNGKANMTVRTLAEVVYALGANVKINAQNENKSTGEGTDDTKMHTLRIHFSPDVSHKYAPEAFIPAFTAGNSAPVCGSRHKFNWEEPEIVQSKSSGSDTRTGLAA